MLKLCPESTAMSQTSAEAPIGQQSAISAVTGIASEIGDGLASVLIRKPDQVRLTTAALLTGSHLLLHDLPGVGKTTLASAAARIVGGELKRVQGSPDLLPTDLTGAMVLESSTGDWKYRPGALLANVVLVDEINRIAPRTQAALLQVMAERRLSVDGTTMPLPDPYFVVATMNPTGSLGTTALAEGQLDRFSLCVSIGPIDREGERLLLQRRSGFDLAEELEPVLPTQAWAEVRQVVSEVHVAENIVEYLLDLCGEIRSVGYLSVRASSALLTLAQGLAVIDGRSFVVPDDVKQLAPTCFAHRLLSSGKGLETIKQRIAESVERVPAPLLDH